MKRHMKNVAVSVVIFICLFTQWSFADTQFNQKCQTFMETYPLGTIYINTQGQRCKEFVTDFYLSCYLINIPNINTETHYSLYASAALNQTAQIVYDGKIITGTDVKNQIQGSAQFSIIQMYVKTDPKDDTSITQHTAMIYETSVTAFKVYDSNWVSQATSNSENRNKIQTHSFSYDNFAQYISFPGGGFTIYQCADSKETTASSASTTTYSGKLLGIWTTTVMGIPMSYEFRSNGTLVATVMGIMLQCEFAVNGCQITVTMDGSSMDMGVIPIGTSTYSISGDQLLLDGIVFTKFE